MTCAEQFRVMAFAQLTYRESLRDIEVCLSAQSPKLYHMGFRQEIKRSTLADANETRDWRIFADFAQRLKRLVHGVHALIDEYRPQEVAIEKVFMAKNPDSALKLGQARGAALCAVVLRDLPVSEYAATEIKLAVVGRGGAEKQQVQHMVGLMLGLQGKLQADAADALAVAITHAHVRATANRLGLETRQAWSRK